MVLYFGNSECSKLYVGSSEISKVYKGTNLVYEAGSPTPSYTINATIVGNPTISSDGIASGFSGSSYLTKNGVMGSSTSVEIGTSFVVDSFVSAQGILDSGNYIGTYNVRAVMFRLTINDSNKLLFRWSYLGGTDAYLVSMTGSTTLSANTRYWVKITFDTTNGYKLYLSTDGNTYSLEASNSTIQLGNSISNSNIVIGMNVGSDKIYFRGSIYLADTYVKRDGTEVWRAATTS